MKILTFAVAFSIFLTACNGNKDSQAVREIIADTTTNSVYENNLSTDTGSIMPPTATTMVAPAVSPVQPAKKIVTKTTKTPQPIIDNTPAPAATTSTTSAAGGTTATAGTTESTTETAKPEEKKGWSSAAKGAVIGAGAGAIGGAVISKKKGTGAIIGGVLGAGAGYIIGKDQDRRKADTTASQ